MHGWRRDLEKPHHVVFGGRPAVDPCVGVNEREILTLERRKGGSRPTASLIHGLSRQQGAFHEYTLSGGPERGGAGRAEKLARWRQTSGSKRAQILLAAHDGVSDDDIVRSVSVSGSTVYRTKRHFVEGNLELALNEEARPGAARKLTGKETALLVATACSGPPSRAEALDPEAAGRGDGPADRA